MKKTGKRPTALGCYIFAGGFTLGVRKHFDVLGHFEEGNYGVATAQRNIKELHHAVWTDPATWPADDFVGCVDFVYGNPPCAPWSHASHGRAAPWRLDPRMGCAQRLFSLIERIRPKVWAWESVRPAFVKGREMVDAFVGALPKEYSATALMVDGTNHGVAQSRPRFFLVAHRVDMPWEPTRIARPVTVREALRGVPSKPRNEFPERIAKWAKHIAPGDSARRQFELRFPKLVAKHEAAGEHVPGRPQFLCRRLRPDTPSFTLTGGTQHIHFKEDRWISVPEAAALCGYPRDFEFVGTLGQQYAQVAQAVMPPVGEYLAKIAAAGIKANKKPRPGFERVDVLPQEVTRQVLVPPPKGRVEIAVAAPQKVARTMSDKPRAKKQSGKPGSGFRIRQMLVKGMQTDAILAVIRKEFPDSKAKAGDVYWNKKKLETQGGVP